MNQSDKTSDFKIDVRSDTTSLTLLERLKERDSDAWRRLLSLYGGLVVTWCKRWKLSEHESADVVQEVFGSVAQKITLFRREHPQDSFRAWLWTITRNACMQYFRDQARQPAAAGGSSARMRLEQIEARTDDDPRTQHGDSQLVYAQALDLIKTEFEPSTWQAFLACVTQTRSVADIASELQLSPGAVRQAKYRVLKRLRDEFGDVLPT
ncbi:MAG: sigma-70 family RNA polymerase sigma factor [Pirellulaceae bacterium]